MVIFRIASLTITTATLSGFAGVFFFTYFVWRRGQIFGFNAEKLFDYSLLFLAAGSLGYLITPYLGAVLAMLASCLYLNKQKYSWRKISRIAAPAFFIAGSIYLAGIPALTLALLFAIFGMLTLIAEKIDLFKDAAYFSLTVLFLSGLQIYYGESGVIFFVSIALFIISAMAVIKSTQNPELTKQLLQKIKEKLQKQEKDIKQEIENLQEQDPYLVDDREGYDVEDDVMEDQGHERLEILKNRLKANLNQVQTALSAVKLGKFGKCSKCGKQISKERLLAHPATEICRQCAQEKE